jgi:DNA-binding HxlR family transcriptional regulator
MALRSYEDGCAAAHALDLVGERWALLVVRELALGAKRFTDLRSGLPGISPNVLTLRLEELERASVLRRRRLLPPAATWVYELTPWGQELVPLLMALGRWGAKSPSRADGLHLSATSLVLSLCTMFSTEAAGDWAATVGLELGHDHFHLVIADGQITPARGPSPQAEAVLVAEPSAMAEVVYGGVKLTEALRSGQVAVRGDKQVAKTFVTLFRLPQPASPVS